MCKIWVILRFGRQGLKAKRGGCKTEVGGKKRRKEKEKGKIRVIKRRGIRVAGVDNPRRFIVGRGPGFWSKMSTRREAPNVDAWSISRYMLCHIMACYMGQSFLGMNQ